MVYRGHVRNGMVVFEDSVIPPEGAEVEVSLRATEADDASTEEEECPTLHERLKPIIGCLTDLPSDFSQQHDHYLYGTPKRP